jgi:hypothetical protein
MGEPKAEEAGANESSCIAPVPLASSFWLGCGVFSPIPTEKQLRNATKGQGANDCPDADPFPSEESERQKPEAITEGSNSAKDEKWSRKTTVNPATPGSVEQTRYTHDRE